MVISKRQIAAAVKRFPLVLGWMHTIWRFTRPRFTAGVIGVLINTCGEVLIVEHVYHSYPQWGLPGGYVDRGEDPVESLVRELYEELQLTVEVGPIVALDRAYDTHLDIAYLCYSDGTVGTLCQELLAYRWSTPDQLPEIRPFHRQAIVQGLALLEPKI
jgi:8-oxo-dGTP pyrophosphatase MutT (NUDIX family)